MKNKREIPWIALLFSTTLFVMSWITGSFSENISGLKTILLSPAQLTIDYFKIGSVGGTFLNAALVGYFCAFLLYLARESVSGTSLMAYFLTVGFSFFGINVGNVFPCFIGTFLYSVLFRKSFRSQVNFAMFSTSLAPFVSEMAVRNPLIHGQEGGILLKILSAVLVGSVCGFLLPILCEHGPNLHKGYSLYNAASVSGFLGVLLFSILFRATGHEVPENTVLGGSYFAVVNGFFLSISFLMLLAGFWTNGRTLKGYRSVLRSTSYRCDFVQDHGIALTMLNIGIIGLFATLYYTLIGAPFNGPTVGCMICLLAVAPCGSTVVNILPIAVGYAIASCLCGFNLNTQAIVVGFSFAAALSPISGRFGSICGVLAGMLHACMVTTVVTFHGGFCLYNGGFTAGIVAIILAPILESCFIPNQKLAVLPLGKRGIKKSTEQE